MNSSTAFVFIPGEKGTSSEYTLIIAERNSSLISTNVRAAFISNECIIIRRKKKKKEVEKKI